MSYNATAYKINSNGKLFSREAVEIDDEGRVVRACGMWSHTSGKPEFEAEWRGAAQFSMVAEIRIDRDGAAGYRSALRDLALPPAYR
jgi:hypothetical protein